MKYAPIYHSCISLQCSCVTAAVAQHAVWRKMQQLFLVNNSRRARVNEHKWVAQQFYCSLL